MELADHRTLDELVAAAADEEPGERIQYRDPIVRKGEPAIDAMADWLSDRRLAGFAIRVLERIGADLTLQATAISALASTDTGDWPAYLVEDRQRALVSLGWRPPSLRGGGLGRASDRPPGSPGQPGIGYWVMRTSPWERPYLWAEAMDGRLRQGWGVEDEQNLYVIADVIRNGGELNGLQREARRALRMLTSWPGGMHVGDSVVAPNLPQYGRLSVFRVAGSYEWSPGPALTWGERFGHVLPVELVEQDIDRHSREVSQGLRSVLGVQTRLYNITGYGGDVERMIGRDLPADRSGEHWTEAEYETMFGRHPANGPKPTEAEIDELSVELGRTADAISWQWNDGAAYVTGRSASTTSQVLMQWLDSRR